MPKGSTSDMTFHNLFEMLILQAEWPSGQIFHLQAAWNTWRSLKGHLKLNLLNNESYFQRKQEIYSHNCIIWYRKKVKKNDQEI